GLNLGRIATEGLSLFCEETLGGKRRDVFDENGEFPGGETLRRHGVAVDVNNAITGRAQLGLEECHVCTWPGTCVVDINRRSDFGLRGWRMQSLRQQVA